MAGEFWKFYIGNSILEIGNELRCTEATEDEKKKKRKGIKAEDNCGVDKYLGRIVGRTC